MPWRRYTIRIKMRMVRIHFDKGRYTAMLLKEVLKISFNYKTKEE